MRNASLAEIGLAGRHGHPRVVPQVLSRRCRRLPLCIPVLPKYYSPLPGPQFLPYLALAQNIALALAQKNIPNCIEKIVSIFETITFIRSFHFITYLNKFLYIFLIEIYVIILLFY